MRHFCRTAVAHLLASCASVKALSSQLHTRQEFLSLNGAAFFSSAVGLIACDPKDCSATELDGAPRYLDSEVDMKFAESRNGDPITRVHSVRRYTGESTPFKFPITSVELAKEWPDGPPFDKRDFFRADQNDDEWFYQVPKFVYHMDEPAVASLTQFYRSAIKPKSDILDICSSWVSHYPREFPKTMGRISGTGMAELELEMNDQLSDYEAKNLNDDPTLPYRDNSFDVVTCSASMEYLIHPVEVMKEVHRVLRPRGKAIVSQSNHFFPSQTVSMWMRMDERQRLELIDGYFQYAGGFKEREALNITANVPGVARTDPMFVVVAEKA